MSDIESKLDLINVLVTRDFNHHGYNVHGFGKEIQFTDGGKFIRLVAVDTLDGVVREGGGSAFGFIVKEDNSVKSEKGHFFKRGDILKAASWKAPAKNFVRGNIFDLTESSYIRWTGVDNMKA